MSTYQNVVGGRLRLKGKPLDVLKAKAKRKKHKHRYTYASQSQDTTNNHEAEKEGSEANAFEDNLTPVERKFLQQTRQLELRRLAKMATKSHRDRIQEFN